MISSHVIVVNVTHRVDIAIGILFNDVREPQPKFIIIWRHEDQQQTPSSVSNSITAGIRKETLSSTTMYL